MDTRGRCGYEIGFLVQYEHGRRHDRRLGCATKKNPFKEQVFRSTMWSTYNAGRKNSIPSGVHKPLANLSRSRMKASPLPLTVPMMIITK